MMGEAGRGRRGIDPKTSGFGDEGFEIGSGVQ